MRLLITRSEPGASRMAEALGAAGLDCQVQPLVAAEPTHQPLPAECFEHVIFVSEHAVQQGREAVRRLADGAQWYAIGPATGAALTKLMVATGRRDAGSVRVPDLARSEGLLSEPELQSIEGAEVLLVAGEDGRELIAKTLQDRGARVANWLVYRRTALSQKRKDWRGAGAESGAQQPIDVCVASSGMGLELLTRYWFGNSLPTGAASGTGTGTQVPVCVPSPRIAKMATALGWQEPILCRGASAEATLSGLVGAGLLDAGQ